MGGCRLTPKYRERNGDRDSILDAGSLILDVGLLVAGCGLLVTVSGLADLGGVVKISPDRHAGLDPASRIQQ